MVQLWNQNRSAGKVCNSVVRKMLQKIGQELWGAEIMQRLNEQSH